MNPRREIPWFKVIVPAVCCVILVVLQIISTKKNHKLRVELAKACAPVSLQTELRRLEDIQEQFARLRDCRMSAHKDISQETIEWEAVHLACDADEDFRTWIAVNWHTGMHSSDIDRFRWQDVDLAKKTWVRRNTKVHAYPVDNHHNVG